MKYKIILSLFLSVYFSEIFPQENSSAFKFDTSIEAANYFISWSKAYFGSERRSWNESSVKLGGTLTYSNFELEVKAMALKTSGVDAFGTGTLSAFANPNDSEPGRNILFELDQAYLKWNNIGNLPLSISLGRQNISLGTQFFIGDGVYDGFHSSVRQAVFHNPRKWFDAFRIQYKPDNYLIDAFIYKLHPSWDGGSERDGTLSGVDVTYNSTEFENYSAGLFYRSSPSNKDNDMAIANLRFQKPCVLIDKLLWSGELVWEFAGTGNNLYYVSSAEQKLNEFALHFEGTYTRDDISFAPFAEVGFVYYSKDYTPIAIGFSDWGKWYLGNQTDWIIFGTDTKNFRAQIGCWVSPEIKTRIQFHNTNHVSTGNLLSNEFSFIAEWYPNANFWLNAVIGYSIPDEGLKNSSLGNPFSWINSQAASVGVNNSLDIIVALGFNL